MMPAVLRTWGKEGGGGGGGAWAKGEVRIRGESCCSPAHLKKGRGGGVVHGESKARLEVEAHAGSPAHGRVG